MTLKTADPVIMMFIEGEIIRRESLCGEADRSYGFNRYSLQIAVPLVPLNVRMHLTAGRECRDSFTISLGVT